MYDIYRKGQYFKCGDVVIQITEIRPKAKTYELGCFFKIIKGSSNQLSSNIDVFLSPNYSYLQHLEGCRIYRTYNWVIKYNFIHLPHYDTPLFKAIND